MPPRPRLPSRQVSLPSAEWVCTEASVGRAHLPIFLDEEEEEEKVLVWTVVLLLLLLPSVGKGVR